MDYNKVKRTFQAVGELLIVTPVGPSQLKSFGRDEPAWLLKTSGQSQELKVGRKAAKMMKEVDEFSEDLHHIRLIKQVASSPGTAPLATPSLRVSLPEAQEALVTYVPSQPMVAPAAPVFAKVIGNASDMKAYEGCLCS